MHNSRAEAAAEDCACATSLLLAFDPGRGEFVRLALEEAGAITSTWRARPEEGVRRSCISSKR